MGVNDNLHVRIRTQHESKDIIKDIYLPYIYLPKAVCLIKYI